MTDLTAQYLKEVTTRLERLAAPGGPIDDAIAVIADSLEAGGVVQAFGTGHSEAFAMEIAGRAGGLIATNRIALRTLVLRGDRDVSDLGGAEFRPARCGRENGDLCSVELIGEGVHFSLAASEGDVARTRCEWPDMSRATEINVPRMTLAEGLARVMARPEGREVFERAWALAKGSLEAKE